MGRYRQQQQTPTAEVDAWQDRRFVTALARGLTVLHCFRPSDRWLPHQELARRTGLPPATVSRLTFTLTALGYLRHRAQTGEYALSPAVLALGFSALSQFDLARTARPLMADLADHTLAAVSLGMRHGTSMVYVAHCRSAARLILGLDVGTRLPLAETAMGRAWWVAATPGLRERVARLLQTENPQAWPQRERMLRAAEADHARRGYVVSEGEWERDISAVGVGLDLGDGRDPLALTVGGASTRLQGALLHQDFAPALVHCAQAVVALIQSGDLVD